MRILLIVPEAKARSHHLLLTHKDSAASSRHTHDIHLLRLLLLLARVLLHWHHASSKLLLHTILLLLRVAHLLLVGSMLAHDIALWVHVIAGPWLLLHFNLI